MANCCCIIPEETADVSFVEFRRAKKEHVCMECGETIPRGRLYENARVLFDRWDTYKTCARCVNIRTDYFTCGWYYTMLVEDFRECFGFDYRDGIPEGFGPCKNGEQADDD